MSLDLLFLYDIFMVSFVIYWKNIHLDYKAAFSFYDKNGNGTIDEQELILVMRTLGENPTEDQMTCIMYEVSNSIYNE